MLNPVTPQDVMVDESDDEEEAGDEHDARRALTAALEGLGSGKGRCQRRIIAHRTGRTRRRLRCSRDFALGIHRVAGRLA